LFKKKSIGTGTDPSGTPLTPEDNWCAGNVSDTSDGLQKIREIGTIQIHRAPCEAIIQRVFTGG